MSDPFKPEDITDVRVIIEVGDKHYSIIPDRDVVRPDQAKQLRISYLDVLMTCHKVASTPLEELSEKLDERKAETT